jgi:hypothetical protein
MAYRLLKPSTWVGVFVNFCRKASLRLWAGSVLMISTLPRCADSCTARLLEQVVLPTPPLPPTQIHFRLFWSRMFCSVGSGSSMLLLCCCWSVCAGGRVLFECS